IRGNAVFFAGLRVFHNEFPFTEYSQLGTAFDYCNLFVSILPWNRVFAGPVAYQTIFAHLAQLICDDNGRRVSTSGIRFSSHNISEGIRWVVQCTLTLASSTTTALPVCWGRLDR